VIEVPGYTIKSEISVGANASVLLAVQTSLDREVALKVVSRDLVNDKAYAERFLQVARSLASFSHPNIVAVYDVGVTPEQAPYFSMQYLPGGDLAARAQRGMSEQQLFETLAGVARALGYVHQRGLIHRAITPRNVLYDGYDIPVLADFGVAPTPTQDSHITSIGFPVEVSRFMSPEQARGGEQDARSDIYCLGALCFYGLTGRPPYDGADGFAVAYAHVFEPIPRLEPERTHWQALIDKALAKDPKDRFANVEQFLDALNAIELDRGAAAATTAADDTGAKTAGGALPATAATPLLASATGATAAAASLPGAAGTQSAEAMAPAKPLWTRIWPLAAVLVGMVLIAVALIPRGAREPSAEQPPTPSRTPAVATPTAPAATTATAVTAATPPAGEAAAAVKPNEDSSAPTSGNADSAAAAAKADAERLALLDAAESQAIDNMDLAKAPTVVDPLNEAIRLGRIDLAAQRFISPPGKNALERFQFALKLEPRSKPAKQGIVDVAKKYIEFADKNAPAKGASAAELTAYSQSLDRAADIAKLVPEGADVLKDIAARRRKLAEPLIAQAKEAADKWDKAAAKSAYELALQIEPDNQATRDGLKSVAMIGEPGFVFHDKLGDGAQAPVLIILPGAKLAMARHPVTRAEFRRYWDNAGRAEFGKQELSCRDRESIFRSSKKRSWENPDIPQDDTHPAVCVGWREAAGYAQWLSKQTGKRYRLPSAAEFDEIASKAPAAGCGTANLADTAFNRQYDSRDGAACDDGFAATSPVEHYAAVAGIFDIDGNVREWIGACGNGTAASAGSACRDFRAKGRGWLSVGAKESATATDTFAADVSLNTVGFRVVREMTN
jgi:formylglycine-generating enzyme required for sulfatase activity/tRNA A-37 threonylcarbamoyl transferase component Bud32